MSTHPMEKIFYPQSIAVVGASGNPDAQGYDLFTSLPNHGYRGAIYPVNPKYLELLGIKVYPSLKEVPGSIDYVICATPASEILNVLRDCSQKRVKTVCLYTARFSETGRPEAAKHEQEILKQAKKWGIRLIGPNCRGIYNPQQRISCYDCLPKETGSAGLIAQTGGGTIEIIELASRRGVYFSKAVCYGNALDYNECDFLEYFSQDPKTKIILMYIEGVRDGKRFFKTLRQTASTKPVIILKGGRGKSGARATASHTASLAGSMKTWETAVSQAGAISAQNFDEVADLAVSFHFLPPIRGRRVGIAGGGGGGHAVITADQCEEAGLDVIPLPTEMREELKSKGLAVWDWIGNPADMSIRGKTDFNSVNMLRMMARNQNFDFLIVSIVLTGLISEEKTALKFIGDLKGYMEVKKESSKPLLAVVPDMSLSMDDHDKWKWKLLCEVRTKLMATNIPWYPTIERTDRAVRKLIDYYQKR